MVSVSTLSGLKRCQILLDAGSLDNWISVEAALAMDLLIQPVTDEEIVSAAGIDAGGNDVVPMGKVAVTWFWEGKLRQPVGGCFHVSTSTSRLP